jgi:hypothetical protein
VKVLYGRTRCPSSNCFLTRVKSDEEVKKILRRLYNLTKPELKLKETEKDKTYYDIVVGVFKQEPNKYRRNIASIESVFKQEPISSIFNQRIFLMNILICPRGQKRLD